MTFTYVCMYVCMYPIIPTKSIWHTVRLNQQCEAVRCVELELELEFM